ncbi:hypothetical protein F5Y10DRAFT_233869 [Nemania abortiva]|nr:hypothetical protein F5Y10DRAFT_233869 [Nemania abortiva]
MMAVLLPLAYGCCLLADPPTYHYSPSPMARMFGRENFRIVARPDITAQPGPQYADTRVDIREIKPITFERLCDDYC